MVVRISRSISRAWTRFNCPTERWIRLRPSRRRVGIQAENPAEIPARTRERTQVTIRGVIPEETLEITPGEHLTRRWTLMRGPTYPWTKATRFSSTAPAARNPAVEPQRIRGCKPVDPAWCSMTPAPDSPHSQPPKAWSTRGSLSSSRLRMATASRPTA